MALTGHLLGPGDPGAALAAAEGRRAGPRAARRGHVQRLPRLAGRGARRRPRGAARTAPGARTRRRSRPTRTSPSRSRPRPPARLALTSRPPGPGSRPGGTRCTTNDPGPEPEYLGAGRPRPRTPASPRRRAARASPHRTGRGRGRRGRRRGRGGCLRRGPADRRRQLAGDRRPRRRGRLRQPRPRPVGVAEDRGLQDPAEVPGASRRSSAAATTSARRSSRRSARTTAARTSTTPRTSSPGSATGSRWPPYRTASTAPLRWSSCRSPTRRRRRQGSARSRAAAPTPRPGAGPHRHHVRRRLHAARRDPAGGRRVSPRTPRPRTLADSEEFTAAMERTGDPGIVTMYASKDAPDALPWRPRRTPRWRAATAPGSRSTSSRRPSRTSRAPPACVRFRDGAVEAEFSGQGPARRTAAARRGRRPRRRHASRHDRRGAAPSRFQDGWLEDYLDQLNA